MCAGCGGDLGGAAEAGATVRQVFDLPPITVQVTEHRLVRRRCSCGTVTTGRAPARVVAPVQYGPRISATVAYLQAGQFLPKQRTADIVADLFGVPVSPGTISTITARTAGAIEDAGVLDTIRDAVTAAPVAHFDETGLRVEGRLRWVHSASTDQYSLLTCHPKRGVVAMNDAGVLPTFTGVAVHDAWAPYDKYKTVTHALCGAHVLRELTAVTDQAEPGSFCWAEQAIAALLELKKLVDTATTARLDHIDPALLERRHRVLHDPVLPRDRTETRRRLLRRTQATHRRAPLATGISVT